MCEQLPVDAELENEQAANDIAQAVEETDTTEKEATEPVE